MKKAFIVLLIIKSYIFSQINISVELENQLRDGINNLIRANYQKAHSIFSKIDTENPNIPLGKIYLAAVEITMCEDYGTNFNDKLINNLLNKAISLSDKIIKENPDNTDGYYYQALAYGYFGYYHSIEKNYFTAFKYGLNSLQKFEYCLSKNKNFIDAYIAIGSYKYWKSKKMNWVPFVEDETAKGLSMLKQSLNSNAYNKHLALYSLIWIYIEEENPMMAVKYAEQFLKEYPENRLVKLAYARAYQDINIDKAISIFNELLQFYQNSNESNNHYKEIVIMHKLAQLYHKKGDNLQAKQLCNKILKIKLDPVTKKRLEKRIEDVKDLLDDLD